MDVQELLERNANAEEVEMEKIHETEEEIKVKLYKLSHSLAMDFGDFY